jgi:hypothetical protein
MQFRIHDQTLDRDRHIDNHFLCECCREPVLRRDDDQAALLALGCDFLRNRPSHQILRFERFGPFQSKMISMFCTQVFDPAGIRVSFNLNRTEERTLRFFSVYGGA